MENNQIYISYSWSKESEEIANEIDNAFASKGLVIIRDKRDAGYKANIDEFMNRIAEGNIILLVISHSYLMKRNCMYELLKICEKHDFYNRIFPVVLSDAKIYKAIDKLDYTKFWSDQLNELNLKVASYAQQGIVIGDSIDSVLREISLFKQFSEKIDNLTDTFRKMNTLSVEILRKNNYQVLVDAINTIKSTDFSSTRNKPSLSSKFVPIYKKYTCDRYEHGKTFHEKFSINCKQPFQFYIIQGEDKQSPEGLFMRFFFEFLQKPENNSIYEKINVEGYNIEDTKYKFIPTLFKNFELPNNLPFNEFTIDKLCQSVLLKDKHFAAIQIKIHSNLWDKHYPEFIKWFNNDFCNSLQIPANAPKFLIFWTAVYKDDTKVNKSFLNIFGNSKKEQIRKCFQTVLKESIFPELPPVKLQDIEVWLDNLKLDDFGSVTQVIKKYFADEKTFYDMWEVEKGLEKIISDYNAGKIE